MDKVIHKVENPLSLGIDKTVYFYFLISALNPKNSTFDLYNIY